MHLPDGPIKFERTADDLYAFVPSEEYRRSIAESKNMKPDGVNLLVSSVSENKKGYTQRQFENAKRARTLYHAVGCPTLENFKSILNQNIIQNCPVTVEDVNIAESIFGPDMGTLKGKTVRRKPPIVKSDLVEIPPELKEKHQGVTLCVDLMHVNGLPMLTAIDKAVRYRSTCSLNDRTADEICKELRKIIKFYKRAGYPIAQVNTDNKFQPLVDPVCDDEEITINPTATKEHVPEAERNNRTIQERI